MNRERSSMPRGMDNDSYVVAAAAVGYIKLSTV